MDSQRVGAFIVKANDAIHFRIVSADDFETRDKYFGPIHSHQIFGENMQIIGYEGLSIDIALSSKFLVPLVKISYTKIAPSGAKDQIDDIEAKLRDHYGVIFTDPKKYQHEVLEVEKTLPKFGSKLGEVKSSSGKTFDLHKVCLTEEGFDER